MLNTTHTKPDEDFGRRLSEKYKDKKLYWKELKDEEWEINVSSERNEVKEDFQRNGKTEF